MVKALPNNITGIVSFFDYIVSVEGLFWVLMLGALWIILFAKFVRFGASRAWITASVACFTISIFVAIQNWMDVKWTYLFAIFIAIGIFWRSLESGEGQ